MRLWISSRYHQFDIHSYWLTADRIDSGEFLYFSRYNYSPLWGHFVWLLRKVLFALGEQSFVMFHLAITGVMTLVCLAWLWILGRAHGPWWGLVFFAAPVVVVSTSFNSMFDLLAVLPAWGAWAILYRRRDTLPWRPVLAASALLTLSLLIKHVMLLFALWLLLWKPLAACTKKRLVVVGIPVVLFLLSFVPYLDSPAHRAAVITHVFAHHPGDMRNGLLPVLLHQLILPRPVWENLLPSLPLLGYKRLAFVLLMLGAGYWAMRKRNGEHALVSYLIALVALTPGLHIQQWALPLLGIGLLRNRPAFWICFAFTCLYALAFIQHEMVSLRPWLSGWNDVAQLTGNPLPALALHLYDVLVIPYHPPYEALYPLGQVWLAVLFVQLQRSQATAPPGAQPPV